MTKKQWLKIAAFCAIFLVVLTGLTYCLRTSGSVKDRFVGFYAEKKNTIDVIAIGSSSVFPYYSFPQMYGEKGIAGYPLSTNLQRPAAQIYLAREALRRQKPELMIFEVRMYIGREWDMIQNMAYTRGVTDNLRYSVNRIRAINGLVTDEVRETNWIQDVDETAYYFDILKYHSNWKSLFLRSQLRTVFFAYPEPLKGFFGSNELGPAELTDFSAETGEEPLEDIQQGHLEELMAFLKENGQDALFIVSPYEITQQDAQKYNSIERLVTEQGFGFLDLNDHYEEMGLAGDDFSDYGTHVNVCGAEKVTAFVEEWMKENYDLPDRRGDAAYASYDAAYENWLAYRDENEALVQERIRTGDFAPVVTEE